MKKYLFPIFYLVSTFVFSQNIINGDFYISSNQSAILDNDIIFVGGRKGIDSYTFTGEKISNPIIFNRSGSLLLKNSRFFSIVNGYYFLPEGDKLVLKRFPGQEPISPVLFTKISDWNGGAFVGFSEDSSRKLTLHYFNDEFEEVLRMHQQDYSSVIGASNFRDIDKFFIASNILPVSSTFFAPSEGLIKIYNPLSKKFGFINSDKEKVIDFKFKDASSFSEGLAIVQNEFDNWGAIDKNGVMIIDFVFSKKPSDFKDGLSKVQSNNWKFGYVNMDGEKVIEPEFSDGTSFFKGHALVINGKDELILINKSGTIISNFGRYISFLDKDADDYSPTLIQLMNFGKGVFKRGMSYGLLDIESEILIDFNFNVINCFDGLHALGHKSEFINGKTKHDYGLIDEKGNFIIMIEKNEF